MAVLRLVESDDDAILPVSLGTLVWLVVLVVLLFQRPTLEEHGSTWWIATAAVGVVSGAGGIVFLRWRKRRSTSRRSGVAEL
jgi:hypothetical protein